MRTSLLALLASATLLLVLGGGVRAAEEPRYVHFTELTPRSQEVVLAYMQESRTRLLELNNLMEKPVDEWGDDPSIWWDILEEEDEEWLAAMEAVREAEATNPDEETEAPEEIQGWFEDMGEQWAWVEGGGEMAYNQNRRMTYLLEHIDLAFAYIEEFKEWYHDTAETIDDAIGDVEEARRTGVRPRIELALQTLKRFLYVAKMLDDVHEAYDEKLTEWQEYVEDDQFGDVDTWFDSWNVPSGEYPLFAAHKQAWKERCRANYDALRKKEEELLEETKPVLDGTFLGERTYDHIVHWSPAEGFAERVEWLIDDYEEKLSD